MEWVRGKVVGRGSFGTVSLATLIKPNQRINTNPNQTSFVVKSCDVSTSSSLENEKNVLTKLGNNHPNIINFLGDSITQELGCRNYNLFLEYASNGSLADQLRNFPAGKFGKYEVQKFTKDILKGLSHVHRCGFVHSDVKLENILVFDDGEAKIADFGLARRVGGDQNSWGEFRGTPLYMSPEIITGGESVTAAADIWAVGCALVEMVSGKPAWEFSPDSDVTVLFYRIGVRGESPKIPGELCDEGKDFLSKCFLKDPSERWTASMLLDHPFLSGFGNINDKQQQKQPFVSPRCPFEFSDWESSECSSSSSSSIGSFDSNSNFDELDISCPKSISSRFELESVCCPMPNWDDSDGWVTIW